jgi:ribosomal protein S5
MLLAQPVEDAVEEAVEAAEEAMIEIDKTQRTIEASPHSRATPRK